MKTFFRFTLLFASFVFANGVFAQQIEREKGIELYKQGKNNEAVTILEKASKQKESGNDAVVWNYLGLAYLEKGDLKKGRKALEKAVKLKPQDSAVRTNLAYAYLLNNKLNNAQDEINKALNLDPQNVAAYYLRGTAYLWKRKFDDALADADKIIALNPNYSSAYILKSDAFIGQFGNRIAGGSTARSEAGFLKQAVGVLEDCLKNCQNNSERQAVQEKLEVVKVFHDYFNRDKTNGTNQTLSVDDNTTPLKILSKLRANYTHRARQAGISGTIHLAVLFAANGRVSQIIVLQGLGYGLDQEAVKAARAIKFEPVVKDGKPISVVKIVQYSFAIY
ncbi:MAG: TonB family protein [Acidobacteria bacterium]|nr:TonB family protein [Acidobacteriota bacterium]MCA1637046.1 TonB family protein [Acidobacteriota bacterium]